MYSLYSEIVYKVVFPNLSYYLILSVPVPVDLLQYCKTYNQSVCPHCHIIYMWCFASSVLIHPWYSYLYWGDSDRISNFSVLMALLLIVYKNFSHQQLHMLTEYLF